MSDWLHPELHPDRLAEREKLVPLGAIRLADLVIDLRVEIERLKHDLWWEREGKQHSAPGIAYKDVPEGYIPEAPPEVP